MSAGATVAGLLDDATARIATTLGLERREARLEARVLAAHAWQVDPAWLIAHDTDPADRDTTQRHRMPVVAAAKPASLLPTSLAKREFFGLNFRRHPGGADPAPGNRTAG